MCGVCGRSAVLVGKPNNQTVPIGSYTLANHFASRPDELVEVAFYPTPATPDAPEHLPPNVKQYFLEAATNVKAAPNAAGAMFRKSVDVALKHVAPEATGTLVKRIDRAAKLGKLTPELEEWAHHVRLEGNDAAHDEDPFTVEEAEALHRFTELVLMYLFTLPGMLAERREPPQGDAGEDTDP